jgi:hypothetical membrane protein
MRRLDRLRLLYTISLALIAQFLVTSLVAMLLYDGGTSFSPEAQGYSFIYNTFSETGRVYGFDGEAKPLTQWLFTGAMVLSGVGFIISHIAFPGLFRRAEDGAPQRGRTAARIAAILGGMVGIGFIAIGVFPTDTQRFAHYIGVYFAFTALLPAVVAAAVALIRHPRAPRHTRAVHIGFILVLAGYLWLIWFGPGRDTETGALVQIVGQKIIVYLGIAVMTFQTATALTVLTRALRRGE